MPRPALALVVLAVAAAALAQAPARSGSPAARAGIEIGELVWTDGAVERAAPPDKRVWARAGAGDPIRTGDTLRSGGEAIARLDFPWMAVTLGPGSMLTIPAATVLSTVLEQGRAEFAGEGRDIVKIQVGRAEVRGGGRLVLRRSLADTSASALEGAFRVRAAGRIVEIKAGQGTVVRDGGPPGAAFALPRAPAGLLPGRDPGYVRSGEPIELRWSGGGAANHVELLALDADAVLLAREAGPSPLRLQVPWLGTYRWRVSVRDARGVESAPSPEGLICSVDR